MHEYEVFFDGSSFSRLKKRKSTIAFVIYKYTPEKRKNKIIFRFSKIIGYSHSDKAELISLITALQRVVQMDLNNIYIKGDLKNIFDCLEGYGKPTSKNKQYYDEISLLLSKIQNYKLSWIPRSENSFANQLCKEAISIKSRILSKSKTSVDK